MRKVYCTLDTETLGGATNPKNAYHIGGVIHDREGEIIAPFNLLVAACYDQIRDDDYHKAHFNAYEEMVKNGSATFVPTLEGAVALVESLFDYYGVDTVMAFNASFDLIKGACSPLIEGRNFIDLWLMACETLAIRKKFSEFCHAHGLQSRSLKSCSTSAETFYAYITGDPLYEEQHTAFEDSLIELEIFKACIAAKKKFRQNVTMYDVRGFKLCPRW